MMVLIHSILSSITYATSTSTSASLPYSLLSYIPSLSVFDILILLLVLLLTLLVYPLLLNVLLRNPQAPPYVASSNIPLLGSALLFGSNPYLFLTSCRKQYGEIFTVKLGSKIMTFICHPASYSSLFKNKDLSFDAVGNAICASVLGQSPTAIGNIEIDKVAHQQYVKYLANEGLPELTRNSYVQSRIWLRNYLSELNNNGSNGECITGLFSFIQISLFEAGLKAMFGDGLDAKVLWPLFNQFDTAFPLLVADVPKFLLAKAIKARSQLRETFGIITPRQGEATLIRERAALFAQHPSVFALSDVGGSQMAVLWAAVANTIPAAFWTIAYLLKDKQLFGQVKQQVNEELTFRPLKDQNDPENSWSGMDISRLSLLDCAVMESLRLATGSMVLRQAIADVTLQLHDGREVHIAKDEHVALYPSITHLDSRVFEDPMKFKIDRFKDNPQFFLDGVKVPSAFLPFGAGVSMCPGRYWAKNEIIIFLALLLQHCDVNAVEEDFTIPDYNYGRVGIGVFPPATDIQVKIKFKKE